MIADMLTKAILPDKFTKLRCLASVTAIDLLDVESISGACSGELVYKFDEKSYRECESIAKVRFKFVLVHKHIYIIIWILTLITLRHSHCECRVTMTQFTL